MGSYYEINVSLNGRHFFATAERSIRTKEDLVAVHTAISQRFKKEDGFELRITHWQGIGNVIDVMDL